ncbi:MAG: hypothetical protein GX937_00185 [Lentisphaerae bacterium]|nr:hypothetical protein [Lentisphaerota bacterium]
MDVCMVLDPFCLRGAFPDGCHRADDGEVSRCRLRSAHLVVVSAPPAWEKDGQPWS